MKPTHVLIAVDFSAPSLRALSCGFWVAEAFSADLTVAHVLVAPAGEDAVRKAEERLASLVPKALAKKARIHAPLVDSKVHEALLHAVEEFGADLIVLGTHGHRSLKRFLLGSTTERLLRAVPVPLITVSKAASEREGEAPSTPPSVKRILHPTDFSDPTEAALDAALEFARRFDADVEVVHAVASRTAPMGASASTQREVAEEQRTLVRDAEESLQRIIGSASVGEVRVRPVVLEGRPWQAILDRVAATDTDLIVMSLHGTSFVERSLLGATAERVIRASPVPVLGMPVG